MNRTFRYTALILCPDFEDLIAENTTLTVEARSLSEAIAIFCNATALDSVDEINFQIIRIETD